MGGGFESNLPSRRGWTISYFNFNSGGCNFILRSTLLILETPPSLQIIIAQSLALSQCLLTGHRCNLNSLKLQR